MYLEKDINKDISQVTAIVVYVLTFVVEGGLGRNGIWCKDTKEVAERRDIHIEKDTLISIVNNSNLVYVFCLRVLQIGFIDEAFKDRINDVEANVGETVSDVYITVKMD